MRVSGCEDYETERMVRDYIETGKEPRFHYVDHEGFRCAWVIIRAEIDRRRRRNERARERRRERKAQRAAELEAAEKAAKKARRLARKAAVARSSRERSKLYHAAKEAARVASDASIKVNVRRPVTGRGKTAPERRDNVARCVGGVPRKGVSRGGTSRAGVPRCPASPKSRFSDRFRGPGVGLPLP